MKFILSILLLLSSPAFAADSTVSALTGASTLTGAELYYCVQGGADRKCTAAQQQALSQPHPGFVSNFWYIQPGVTSLLAGFTAFPASQIFCSYSSIPKPVTVLGLSATVTAVGTTNFQLAIYANANGRPSTLIGNTGNILNTSTGPKSANLVASKSIGPGGTDGGKDVWFCANQGDGTGSFVTIVGNASYAQQQFIGDSSTAGLSTGASDPVGSVGCNGASCTGASSAFGTWPATLAGSTWTLSRPTTTGQLMPVIQFQAQ